MKIIEPKVEIIAHTIDPHLVIEYAARNCYKSHDYIKEGSSERLFNQIVKQTHHNSVAEHAVVTFMITTDRAVMAQMTRHRHASYSIESQRYVNYSKDKFGNEVGFIKPFDLQAGTTAYEIWESAMSSAEKSYFELLDNGCKPETARAVLPNSAKTDIVMTMNVSSLRNFFSLRCSPHAQSDIRNIANLMMQAMKEVGIPEWLFDDVT